MDPEISSHRTRRRSCVIRVRAVSEREPSDFPDVLWNGADRKLASLDYQLKSRFQRPRPYQVAFLEGRPYKYVWVKNR